MILRTRILVLLAVLLGATSLAAAAGAQCVKFDGLAAGTVWGSPAGHSSGDVVHVENGIRVSVRYFQWTSTTGTFNRATVDNSWSTSSPNSINTNNINLGFDFTGLPGLPTQVAVKFRDLGGMENLALNGNPITIGELASGANWGLNWTVSQFPVPGGRAGKLTVNGTLHSLTLGGQEFHVDTLCVTQGAKGSDHFKIYDVDDVPAQARVALRGQFDEEPKKTRVGRLTHFANPVSKNGEPIVHENAHLTFYDIRQEEEEPERSVAVANQFGRQRLRVGAPVLLAVPAEKQEKGSSYPEHLDHYKCYKATGEPISFGVTMRDQFGTDRSRVGRPRLLCLPVEKEHDGKVHEIRDRTVHLVAYEIERDEAEREIVTRDQFGEHELKVLARELLCVPSQKLFIEQD